MRDVASVNSEYHKVRDIVHQYDTVDDVTRAIVRLAGSPPPDQVINCPEL